MSYDVRLEADLGAGRVGLDLLDENYTYNVSPMFRDILGYSITDWDGKRANEVEEDCKKILAAFVVNPEKYRAMNPSNGWGSFEGARDFIQKIADACSKAPMAFVNVS